MPISECDGERTVTVWRGINMYRSQCVKVFARSALINAEEPSEVFPAFKGGCAFIPDEGNPAAEFHEGANGGEWEMIHIDNERGPDLEPALLVSHWRQAFPLSHSRLEPDQGGGKGRSTPTGLRHRQVANPAGSSRLRGGYGDQMGFVKRRLKKDIHRNSQGYAQAGEGDSEGEEREADPPDEGGG
jgi:hypothetical protein